MTSHVMNHEEAISRLAAERYLLGEMQEEERAAFEEHYLNCAQCLEDVTFGDEFMQAAQPVARDLATAEAGRHAPTPVRESSGFFGWLLAGLRTPAPAWAMAVLVLAFGGAMYQQIQLRSALNTALTPRVVGDSVFLPPAARDGNQQADRGTPTEITVGPNDSIPLDFDLPTKHSQFASYQGQILNESGRAVLPAFSLSTDKLAHSNRVQILVPQIRDGGAYQLEIYGSAAGEKEKHLIARYKFVLKFKN